jgi:hypothetical protein
MYTVVIGLSCHGYYYYFILVDFVISDHLSDDSQNFVFVENFQDSYEY